MAFIYKITNNINNKIYVGKTEYSIEKRFKEHCNDAFKERCEKRPLYSAMRKYGVENFHIELIEETNNPEEREIYWITYYKGYEDGYNATKGGDGKKLFNYEEIAKTLKQNPYPTEVAKQFNCSADTVRNIAKIFNILVKNKGNINLKTTAKTIYQFTKNNELINSFNSTVEAGQWCYENKKCATLNSGVRGHIADCANGKRKSAYGYIWRYDIPDRTNG